MTTTLYDNAGNVQATVDPLGNRTTYAYDSQNRQIAVTDALGHVSTTVYDTAGNVQGGGRQRQSHHLCL